MDAFFGLHVQTRRRLGVPTQPRRFFVRVRELFAHGLGFVLVAEWEGRPIAANVYLRHRNVLTYKYGASHPDHLDKRPNDLLHVEALRIACDSGCESLDLGRTERDNIGLQRFKRQLGGEQRALVYTSAPPFEGRSVRSVSGFQHAVVRRSPPALGRLVGAALYRHFA
jgi:lipid II:glycine glycyltransferase (peptidoglycan interpeptide bridge formation enzyme)